MVKPLGAREAARMISDATREGRGIVVLLVLGPGPDSAARRVVTDQGGTGALEDPALTEALDRLGRSILAEEVTPGPRGRDAGSRTLEVEGRELRVYVERYLPPPELVVVGAGHLARPVTTVAALLGFRVTVLDDRPDFVRTDRFPEAERVLVVDFTDPFRDVEIGAATHVLLVTRGHRYDYECLRRLLVGPTGPAYIGMIGSRRRVRATYHQLREDGFTSGDLSRIRAPVGLDLGAETPEEIAIAVAGELVLLRRGGTGAPLARVEDVAGRFFADPGEPGRPTGEAQNDEAPTPTPTPETGR